MKHYLSVWLVFACTMAYAQQIDKESYAKMVAAYRNGIRDYASMPRLADQAKALKQNALSDSIAQDFIDHYVADISKDSLLVPSTITYIRKYNKRSDNMAFKTIYQNQELVDRLNNQKNVARNYIDFVVAREEVDARLWEDRVIAKPISDKPDWDAMIKKIKQKYNADIAERVVLNAKVRWYNYRKDTTGIIQSTIAVYKRYGTNIENPPGQVALNNFCYNFIFLHSTDTTELNAAIRWMEPLVKNDPKNAGAIDTYANLLYKAGRKEEAIEWEQKAYDINPNEKVISNLLQKMRQGLPTWK